MPFRVAKGGEPLLVFGPGIVSFSLTKTWEMQAYHSGVLRPKGWLVGGGARRGGTGASVRDILRSRDDPRRGHLARCCGRCTSARHRAGNIRAGECGGWL
jgi:hypothetical protein